MQNDHQLLDRVVLLGFVGFAAYLLHLVGLLLIIGAIALVFTIYFLPTLVAARRGVANLSPILLVNVFFGWTFVGWLAAIFIAILSQTKIAAEIERDTLSRLKAKSAVWN